MDIVVDMENLSKALSAMGITLPADSLGPRDAADTITSLRARCASLEAERDEWKRVADEWTKAAIEQQKKVTRAEAMCTDLAKALEPFARIAEMENAIGTKDGASVIVNVSRCRDAHKALAAYRKEAAHE